MTDTTEKTEQQQKAEARNAAQNALNEKYRDELRSLTKAEFDKRGLTYKPKQSDEEKAAAQLRALLTQYPNLAAEVTGAPTA